MSSLLTRREESRSEGEIGKNWGKLRKTEGRGGKVNYRARDRVESGEKRLERVNFDARSILRCYYIAKATVTS